MVFAKKEKVMMGGLELPDEVVLSSILPLLSMKDVARSSLVSRAWLRHWRNTPILSFHDPGMLTTMFEAVKDFPNYCRVITNARRKFIRWVDNVIAKHVGCLLEEFEVVYFFNKTHQVNIDRWVAWALSKHVQRLSLDFTASRNINGYKDPQRHYYVLDRTLLESSNTTKLCLTSLCLKGVNVDTQTVEYLLHACASTLEKLCIDKSQCLTSIAAASLPALKCLMVVDCPKLEIVDIQAPKLVSLTYESGLDPILRVFEIRNASNLCYAKISVMIEERLWFVLCSLSEYFWHLEDLRLEWQANPHINLVLVNFPVLPNLKHLELVAGESGDRTLAAWIPFIAACPRLQKFTLEIYSWLSPVPPKIIYQDECPLRCLKTFEIRNFNGRNLDVDIANFVVENAINLQEVILHQPCNVWGSLNFKAPFSGVGFKLPPHIKLVLDQPISYPQTSLTMKQ